MKGKLLTIGSLLLAVVAWFVDGLNEDRRLKQAVKEELDRRETEKAETNDEKTRVSDSELK